jgi:hypothetical protein
MLSGPNSVTQDVDSSSDVGFHCSAVILGTSSIRVFHYDRSRTNLKMAILSTSGTVQRNSVVDGESADSTGRVSRDVGDWSCAFVTPNSALDLHVAYRQDFPGLPFPLRHGRVAPSPVAFENLSSGLASVPCSGKYSILASQNMMVVGMPAAGGAVRLDALFWLGATVTGPTIERIEQSVNDPGAGGTAIVEFDNTLRVFYHEGGQLRHAWRDPAAFAATGVWPRQVASSSGGQFPVAFVLPPHLHVFHHDAPAGTLIHTWAP